ncbi:MAG: hypothetical protein PHQ23_05665, partial [Candidatus Wallbacteria bacterium]|nr:hypothetical protein [Candidatus Wallbacteria bacterium]
AGVRYELIAVPLLAEVKKLKKQVDQLGNATNGQFNVLGSGVASLNIGVKDNDAASIKWSEATSDLRITLPGFSSPSICMSTESKVGIGTDTPLAPLHIKYAENYFSEIEMGGLLIENNASETAQISFKASIGGVEPLFPNAVAKIVAHAVKTPEKIGGCLDLMTSDGSTMKTQVRISESGNVGIGTTNPLSMLDIEGDSIRICKSKTPEHSDSIGIKGEIAWDSDYLYVCTGNSTWKRVKLSDKW